MNFEIETARLKLIPLTEPCTRAAPADRALLERETGAEVPLSWPVEHYDQEVLEHTADVLKTKEGREGWLPRYVIVREPRPFLAGMVGMMAPDPAGACVIGYSILSEYRRHGYASEALAGVVDWGFAHAGVRCMVGETYPELIGSIRTMERNGFRLSGRGSGERIIRYELTREAWVAGK